MQGPSPCAACCPTSKMSQDSGFDLEHRPHLIRTLYQSVLRPFSRAICTEKSHRSLPYKAANQHKSQPHASSFPSKAIPFDSPHRRLLGESARRLSMRSVISTLCSQDWSLFGGLSTAHNLYSGVVIAQHHNGCRVARKGDVMARLAIGAIAAVEMLKTKVSEADMTYSPTRGVFSRVRRLILTWKATSLIEFDN